MNRHTAAGRRFRGGPNPLSIAELRLVVAAAAENPPLHDALVIAVTTGVSASELSQLRWADVDFTRRCLKVTSTKSMYARSVPFGPRLLELLRTRHDQNAKSQFVFGTSPARLRLHISAQWHNLVTSAIGGRAVSFHDLRRTFAAQWIAIGGTLICLARVMGYNSSFATIKTLSSPELIYTVAAEEQEKLEKELLGDSGQNSQRAADKREPKH